MSYVYVLHMQKGDQIHHYIGYTDRTPMHRAREHAKGLTQFTAAYKNAGFTFRLAKWWNNSTLADEAALIRLVKRDVSYACGWCPICGLHVLPLPQLPFSDIERITLGRTERRIAKVKKKMGLI